MSCERYDPAVIGDLIDGSLDPDLQADLAAHLDVCLDCRRLRTELQQIRDTASTLESVPPPPDLWDRVAGRIRAEADGRGHRRVGWVTPGRAWGALAATLLIVTSAAFYVARVGSPPPSPTAGAAPAATTDPTPSGGSANARTDELVESIEAELKSAEAHYVKAIAGLEEIARGQQANLDPQLASTLQTNMAVIDRAITESRTALLARPDSPPAQQSLFEALRRKVALLQDTIVLMNEMRKGNEVEAGRIVEGLNKS